MMITKKEARERSKEYRRNLDMKEADRYSLKICETLMTMYEYEQADVIYVYKSVNNEVDMDYLIRKALAQGKTVALPKVCDKQILFYKITDDSDLVYGYMGIPEPAANPYNLTDADDGLIIVPGLAFDTACNRTGYGGGFYDRFLAEHPGLIKAGVAYDAQIYDGIETDDFDIKVDMIISEKRVYHATALL